jgi:uncharacterized protein YciU (UPF0263 family)
MAPGTFSSLAAASTTPRSASASIDFNADPADGALVAVGVVNADDDAVGSVFDEQLDSNNATHTINPVMRREPIIVASTALRVLGSLV